MSNKLFSKKALTISNGQTVYEPRSKTPLVIIGFLIAVWFSAQVTKFDLGIIFERGGQFFSFVAGMIPPNWSYFNKIIEPLLDTIKMSLLGSFIGAFLAIPIAIVSASNIVTNKIIVALARFFLSIARTLPTLVIALIATYIFGLGTIAGTIAITIYTFSYVGKQLYEQIETVDMGAYEACEALGATKLKSFIVAIVPQVLPGYLATSLYCFEGNVRYAAVLGYVGAGGIGLILNEAIGWRDYDNVGMIILMLFITVVIIEAISYYLRQKLT